MHQGGHTVGGRRVGGVDVECGVVVCRPQDDFLAPVAEEVGLQIWCRLGAVAAAGAVETQTGGDIAAAVPFADGSTVEQFVLQVAIPVDAEIHRSFLADDLLAGLGAEGILVPIGRLLRASVRRPELITTVAGNDVGSQSAAVIGSTRTTFPDNLAGGGIVDIPGVGAFLLMHIEELESGTVWVEVGQMDGIAVTEADTIEHLAIVVEGGRTPDDLILAVAVDIGD